jgi:hypothetical protein
MTSDHLADLIARHQEALRWLRKLNNSAHPGAGALLAAQAEVKRIAYLIRAEKRRRKAAA